MPPKKRAASQLSQNKRKPAFKNTYNVLENAPQLFAAICICFNIPTFSRQVQFVSRAVHDYIRSFHYRNLLIEKIKPPLPLGILVFLDYIVEAFPIESDDSMAELSRLFPEWFLPEPANPKGRQSTPIISDADVFNKLQNARAGYLEKFVPLFFDNFIKVLSGGNQVCTYVFGIKLKPLVIVLFFKKGRFVWNYAQLF